MNDGVDKVSSSGKRWLIVDDEFLFLALKANDCADEVQFQVERDGAGGVCSRPAVNMQIVLTKSKHNLEDCRWPVPLSRHQREWLR